jgi:hypothetical protein
VQLPEDILDRVDESVKKFRLLFQSRVHQGSGKVKT